MVILTSIRRKGRRKQGRLWDAGEMLHRYGFSPLVLFFLLQGKGVFGDVWEEDVAWNISMQQGDVNGLG